MQSKWSSRCRANEVDCRGLGFAYRRPDRHPVPDSDDTGTQRPVSSTRNRHPVLDDGIGLKWGPGTVLDGSGTDPVPDNGVGIGIGRYRYRITVSVSVFNLPDFLLKNAGRTLKKFNLLKNAGRTASDVRNCRLRNAGRTPDVRIAECRKRRNVGRKLSLSTQQYLYISWSGVVLCLRGDGEKKWVLVPNDCKVMSFGVGAAEEHNQRESLRKAT